MENIQVSEKAILEVVRMRIIEPIKMEWKCPHCGKPNEESFHSSVRKARVKCDYCGRIFITER